MFCNRWNAFFVFDIPYLLFKDIDKKDRKTQKKTETPREPRKNSENPRKSQKMPENPRNPQKLRGI